MRRSLVLAAALALACIACVPAVARAQYIAAGDSQRVPGQRFEALAKPVVKNLSVGSDEALIQAVRIPDQTVPAGRLSLVVGPAMSSATYVNVPISIEVNGQFIRQVFVGYRVQKYVYTAVATHDLVPGAVIDESDVKMARVAFNGGRINGTDVLVGRKVVAAVRAGAPIPIEFTQVNQLVRAGMTVVLVVLDNGVSVVAEVVARTSGGLGDDVSVYNPKTNKTLSGTVIGPDRVELNLAGDAQ
jgi:flagella basal body P-ring formation protein FlgA